MAHVWTTQSVSEVEQFSYWREAICDAFVPLEPEREQRSGFRGRIDSLGLDTLKGSTISADAHFVQLTRRGIARQRHAPFFVNLLCSGEAEVHQHGEVAIARPGDVYVVDSSAPWAVHFSSEFRMFCVELDEDTLRHRLGRRGRLASPVLPGDRGPGGILARYMRLVAELQEREIADMQSLMVEHCAALLARAAAACTGTAPEERDRRQSLQAILAYMDSRVTDPGLSVEETCQALRISRSYLFKILSEAGHTFNGYLREARLRGARAALLAHPEAAISQIAFNWGFGDSSSFNRAYRRAFGEAPSETRRSA